MDRFGWWWPLSAVFACASEPEPQRRIVFDFEAGEERWEVAAGNLNAEPSGRQIKVRRHGDIFLDSAEADGKRDHELHGLLVSPRFRIDHAYLVFRAGGFGDENHCWLELRDAASNKRRRKMPVAFMFAMETHIVDVESLLGRDVRMQLVDGEKGEPCSIHLDWVRLVDG